MFSPVILTYLPSFKLSFSEGLDPLYINKCKERESTKIIELHTPPREQPHKNRTVVIVESDLTTPTTPLPTTTTTDNDSLLLFSPSQQQFIQNVISSSSPSPSLSSSPPLPPSLSSQPMETLTETKLQKLLVRELQNLCKHYGLPQYGVKRDLIQRLVDHKINI
jgi:hypothetical protein